MRRPRSDRPTILARDELQASIIAELVKLRADQVAANVLRCWADRLAANPSSHKRVCRSCSCLSCRRPSLQAWWRSFLTWCEDGGATSYVCLPVGDALSELPMLAKRFRNARDRLADESWLFSDVAALGIAGDSDVHVLISHPGLTRGQVAERLSKLWPGSMLENAPTELVIELTPPVLARLAIRKRGFQSARFVISPRQTSVGFAELF